MILPQALLFDMDGTLTAPALDFPRIKAAMGIGDRAILEAMQEMDPTDRAKAEAVLTEFEQKAAAESKLNPGCEELLTWIEQRGIPMALITRNSRASMDTVLRRHRLRFSTLLSRENGRPKPHPEAIHTACASLGVEAKNVWMIGDGRYDVEAGNAAGARTVWLSHGRDRGFEATPWRVVADLIELTALLRNCL